MTSTRRTKKRLLQLKDFKHLQQVDKEVLWHPYTQMAEYAAGDPIIIDRGDGPYLYDIRRRRFLDAFGSMWCNVWGHSRPELVKAIQQQAERLAHTSLFSVSHTPAIQFADLLVEAIAEDFRFAPDPCALKHVFYSDNGSTAVEVAMKMALQFQNQTGQIKRTQFLSFHDGYHGDTFGAMAASSIDVFRRKFAPSLFKVHHATYPTQVDPDERPDNFRSVDRQLEATLAGNSDRLAAVIIEPVIQGASGMRPLADDFLARVKKYCHEYGILLITDEVFTGFCRTGPIIASSAELVEPDIICLGKGITGGIMPMGVTVASDRVYGAFQGEWKDFNHLLHGHTFSGNPIACAAAIANLNLTKQEKLKENVKLRAREFSYHLKRRIAPHPRVGKIRQKGLAIGVPILDARGSEDGGYEARKDANLVCREAINQRVLLRPLGNVITIVPPLAIGSEHVEEIVAALEQSLKVFDKDPSQP